MMAIVATKPISAGISASSAAFQQYMSGIINVACNNSINHEVVIVGYSYNSYWIIKTSWGTGWGENGYAKVSMASVQGSCCIHMFPTYPVV
ncbi:unnamed protein product [Blepharisma stoltei]|uniref:Peptidase C1A papain C-terminal domain-containing protein n=1 Tax=Blepharisma stoltei TaxID=1481888 RepID=A0AAU9JMR8_9CILI|nr:unnamed protein product [Blepharisma stoltei]